MDYDPACNCKACREKRAVLHHSADRSWRYDAACDCARCSEQRKNEKQGATIDSVSITIIGVLLIVGVGVGIYLAAGHFAANLVQPQGIAVLTTDNSSPAPSSSPAVTSTPTAPPEQFQLFAIDCRNNNTCYENALSACSKAYVQVKGKQLGIEWGVKREVIGRNGARCIVEITMLDFPLSVAYDLVGKQIRCEVPLRDGRFELRQNEKNKFCVGEYLQNFNDYLIADATADSGVRLELRANLSLCPHLNSAFTCKGTNLGSDSGGLFKVNPEDTCRNKSVLLGFNPGSIHCRNGEKQGENPAHTYCTLSACSQMLDSQGNIAGYGGIIALAEYYEQYLGGTYANATRSYALLQCSEISKTFESWNSCNWAAIGCSGVSCYLD